MAGLKAVIPVGQKFARLTVLAEAPRRNAKRVRYICVCDCGNFVDAQGESVRRGYTRSCGCFKRERQEVICLTHGMTGSPEYRIWGGMMQRCLNPNNASYIDYGGKGIGVCKEWKKFIGFFGYMGFRPSPKHELDRIDNSKGYEPGNVRWTVRYVNNRNHSRNVWVVYNGLRMCLTDAAAASGISFGALKHRYKAGHRSQETLFAPVQEKYSVRKNNPR